MLRRLFALALIAALLPPAAALAEQFSVAVPVLPAPPDMNGRIDASWSKATQLPVLFDFTYQRDGEPATVYVAQDAHALDLAFDVTQKIGLTDNTVTNGPGVLNDDNVAVVLWPQASGGFAYSFSANARGARYQTSTENSAYSPQWTAAATRTANGYVVTMRIPFAIMRSGGSKAWRVQFERVTQATNSTQVWSHIQGQRNAADEAYAGVLSGIGANVSEKTARTQPRLQIYALGEMTNASNGGNTSRLGADLALPATATSSFLASVHPDYSNVEVDQQTIAPSAFPRFYNEVRPFFTQLAQNYNRMMACSNCPTFLYTPAIPTFRDGYAYEGTQGNMSFAAFDTSGLDRSDNAEAFNYSVVDQSKGEQIAVQRVAVNGPGFTDDTTSLTSGYSWQRSHNIVYFNTATDRGTFVTDPGLANYLETGFVHADKDTTAGINYQEIGPQFLPVDGFVSQPDVYGVALFILHTQHYGAKNILQDVQYNNFLNLQHDHNGNSSFKADNAQINFDFRDQLTLHVFGGYGKNETVQGEYLPFNQNGFFVGYKTQTTTPSSITYESGPYYHGSLTSWSYITTRPLMRSLKLSLEADENTYAPGGTYVGVEPIARQWLERASIDWQFSRFASFDFGARRIVGRNLPNAFQVPDLPNPIACGGQNTYTPFDCVKADNLSAAFHFLAAHNEWYVVYGNPNDLSTMPAFYVKWIRYFGAEKGT
jgi:hypothetical protein